MLESMQGNPSSAQTGPPAAPDPAHWVDDHGDCLFRFALMRLRDPARAEDAVQETFLAALKGGHTYAGLGAERTWLIGILKNKICDYYRRAGREISFTDLEFYSSEESESFLDAPLAKAAWDSHSVPQEWSDPWEGLDRDVFWKTFRECTDKLPGKVATAFYLREIDGVESREICALLNIAEGSFWVMLHRARMALRRCLEINWFDKNKTPS
jgi:RNA polymerase sigma-70 factor, ECF subfamily